MVTGRWIIGLGKVDVWGGGGGRGDNLIGREGWIYGWGYMGYWQCFSPVFREVKTKSLQGKEFYCYYYYYYSSCRGKNSFVYYCRKLLWVESKCLMYLCSLFKFLIYFFDNAVLPDIWKLFNLWLVLKPIFQRFGSSQRIKFGTNLCCQLILIILLYYCIINSFALGIPVFIGHVYSLPNTKLYEAIFICICRDFNRW